jgi:carboxypeptidase C (cathepsin A)
MWKMPLAQLYQSSHHTECQTQVVDHVDLKKGRPMLLSRTSLVTAALLTITAFSPVSAAVDAPSKPSSETAGSDALEPFPADKSIRQSAIIAGHKIDYVATVGSIKLRDERGKVTGEIVFVAYTVPGRPAETRPVTFSFNGGPGAAQVALNLGAIGPKRISTGIQGATPSDSSVARDNPNSWLDFTDLVFIDPIGTGYSRSHLDEEGTKKTFLTADTDIHYLSEVIYQWLRANSRMTSPKYLIGESYGGYRVPRLAEYLQTDIGIGVSGIVMVSPALASGAAKEDDTFSPLGDMINLPSQAAAHFEAEGQTPTEALLAPVEQYARTQFVSDVLAGPADHEATNRLVAKVSELTGLDRDYVRRMNGRLGWSFVREFHRESGTIGSSYDANVTTYDPFPAKPEADYDDPILATDAPREEAMVDFIDHQVGWKVSSRYIANNYDLNGKFERGMSMGQAVIDLRKALANDPKMKVLVSHGYNDFACPFFGSQLVINQMPSYGVQNRVALKVYPGGHMFYDRQASATAWRRDAMAVYAR